MTRRTSDAASRVARQALACRAEGKSILPSERLEKSTLPERLLRDMLFCLAPLWAHGERSRPRRQVPPAGWAGSHAAFRRVCTGRFP